MSKINLIFYKTPFDDQIIKDLTSELLDHNEYNFITSYEPKDVVSKIPTLEAGVFLFYINDKYDLQEALLILKSIRKFEHAKFFKFFCVLTYDYNRSEMLLKKLGCLGFYTPAEKPARVAKKIELLRKKIIPHLTVKKKEEVFDLPLDSQTKPAVEKNIEIEPIQFISALDIPSDTWIIKSKLDCSFTSSLWKVNVWGPSPHIGKWVDVTVPGALEKKWKFDVFDSTQADCFVEAGGEWIFEGERPVYNWGDKYWVFKAKNPHLYFLNSNDEKYSRFYFENSTFLIAENSEAAYAKEGLIKATGEVKLNNQEFNELRRDYASKSIIREFSLESGEVSVDLEFDPNISDFNLKCDFEDLHDKELIVLAPHNSMVYDAKVRAQVVLKYNGREADVICHGKVTEIETLDDKDSLTIDVEKMNQDKLKEFLSLYSLRQANINDFMTRARGF